MTFSQEQIEALKAEARLHPRYTFSKNVLSFDDVSKVVEADFETGKLFWKARTPDMFKSGKYSAELSCRTWNTRFAGKEAFCIDASCGYRRGRIYGVECVAHRVIWLLHTGKWPEGEIDHINGVRSDNRLCNLRDVSREENRKNTKLQHNNTTGMPGVSKYPGVERWRAYIKTDGRVKHLGCFTSFEAAAEARIAAATSLGFHQNHGRV